ncbi:MAG: TolC family protein [Planctomycetaceae bacterium]|nr:TolC family protein [Planctomycetaceae bacterium]MCL2305221.1 TolC family protein [Planctomycetaceae bacterium]
MFAKRKYIQLAVVIFCSALLLGLHSGCSRSHYRQKANNEAYALVNTVASDSRWQLHDYSLNAAKDSRHYDPFDPDCEPMPGDDPTAQRLMQRVDGKKGSKAWEKYGKTSYSENPHWRQYLSVDETGAIVLDKETAVRLALKHSPAYQTTMENLYKSALLVSLQRYHFDAKFFGGNSLLYTATGKPTHTLKDTTDLGMTRNFASGADILVGFANTLTWQFSGQDGYSSLSALNFSFVQPLLRGSGRAVALENLTQAERNFLAEVRHSAYYQQGFYVSTVTGSTGIPGLGGGGKGYYDLLSQQVQINNQMQQIASLEDTLNRTTQMFIAGRPGAGRKVDVINTRIRLLSSQNELLQKKGNYEGMVEAYLQSLGLPPDQKVRVQDPLLEQFELMSPSLRKLQEDLNLLLAILRDENQAIPDELRGRIPVFAQQLRQDVGIVEKDLIYLEKTIPERIANLQFLEDRPSVRNGEVSSDVCSIPEFQERIRSLQIALPEKKSRIEMIVELNERLAPYDKSQLQVLIEEEKFDEETLEILYRLNLMDVLPVLNREISERIEKPYREQLDPLTQKRRRAQMELNRLEGLLSSLENSREDRPFVEQTYRETREKMDLFRKEVQSFLAEISQVEAAKEKEVQKRIHDWVAGDRTLAVGKSFEKAREEIRQERTSDSDLIRVPDSYRTWLNRVSYRLASELNELLILQARIRLDSITLMPIDVSAEEAFNRASENRLDWMNQRAALVDAWRQIEITGNALRGVLDLKVDGEIKTEGNNPFNFRGKTGTVSVGLNWKTPLDRLREQNAYRTALINYQKARRDYYTYVDSVKANLRSTVRDIQVSQLGFEIQRENVFSAIVNVDSAMLNLENPDATNVNATRDVLDNLNSLLNAQNTFMSTWVQYLQQRMRFELAMGIFQLDSEGMWIDTGPLRDKTQKSEGFSDAPIPFPQVPEFQQLPHEPEPRT